LKVRLPLALPVRNLRPGEAQVKVRVPLALPVRNLRPGEAQLKVRVLLALPVRGKWRHVCGLHWRSQWHTTRKLACDKVDACLTTSQSAPRLASLFPVQRRPDQTVSPASSTWWQAFEDSERASLLRDQFHSTENTFCSRAAKSAVHSRKTVVLFRADIGRLVRNRTMDDTWITSVC
jgi:hypothetical protein